MDINLHIECLVLEGVDIPYGQQGLLQASVMNELTQLIGSGELSPKLAVGASLSSVMTNCIQLGDQKPLILGQLIAKSLYGGIGSE